MGVGRLQVDCLVDGRPFLMFMTGSLGRAGVVGGWEGGGLEDARGARGGPRESSLRLGHSPTKAKQANFAKRPSVQRQLELLPRILLSLTHQDYLGEIVTVL